jgi:hypothetical protein
MPSTPSTILTLERTRNLCVRKTSRISQTHTSSIVGMRGVRSKRYLRHQRVAPWAEDPMANGLAQDLHHTPGRMAIEDMDRRTEGRLVANEVEVATTGGHLGMTTDRLHHLRQEIAGRTGVTVQMCARVTFLHHLVRAAISYRAYHLVTAPPMEVTGDEELRQPAMYTSRATMTVRGDQGNQTKGNGEAHATLVNPEMVLQMTAEIAAEATVIGTGTGNEQLSQEILVGTEGTAGHDLGAQSDGTGIVTTETMTSIDGASHHEENSSGTFQVTRSKLDVHISSWRTRATHDLYSVFTASRQRTRMPDLDLAPGVCSISTAS